ncbi:hypothetical protein [Hymenobacter sp. B1770]|uniref:hypothetical protein n=1 Tax=Hymenobacter sp. B1770 TaxID=1718788 RepID=UPI003CED61BB
MKANRARVALLGVACLAVSPAANGQQAVRMANRVDSLRAARDGKPVYSTAMFTFVSGKQVRGYVDGYYTCLLDQVQCYEVPPDRLPTPPSKPLVSSA